MGGMCARVCPTEVLCEQVCVRNTHEEQPVRIGLLQRYVTDPVINANKQLFDRGPDTGKHIAVMGGGPAGLSCAHRLSMFGHQVTVFDKSGKLGGLNEYGIAAYKTVDSFAQREVNYLLGIGGISVEHHEALGKDFELGTLLDKFDALFLGFGLDGVNDLGLDNDDVAGVLDAVDYIAELRQSDDLTDMPVGRNVVVIGGGMTAVDVAVQSKQLGAETVSIVYRRGKEQMSASEYEQEFAQTKGVAMRYWQTPKQIVADNGHVTGVEFAYTKQGSDGRLKVTDETSVLPADVVFKAIGQRVTWEELGETHAVLKLDGDRIQVTEERRTSVPRVWAGGDCVAGGEDLTVSAVQDGKIAAININEFLSKSSSEAMPWSI